MPYELKEGYVRRDQPEYWSDGDVNVNWQPDVYVEAAELARRLGAHRIVDVGSGNGDKLVANCSEFDLTGIDYGANLAECRRNHGEEGTWIEADLDDPAPISVDADGAVVVCSDVIEHLRRPDVLLQHLKRMLDGGAVAVIVSTPDRDLRRGERHLGPPPNVAHVQEWSLGELGAFLARAGLESRLGLTRTNTYEPFLHTCFAVAAGPTADAVALEDWWRYRTRWQEVATAHEAIIRQFRRRPAARLARRLRRLLHR